MSDLVCDVFQSDEEKVTEVKKQMPEEERLDKLSQFFKAFSDLSRLKIITALSKSELCVCDLCEITNMTQSAVSHQMKYLIALDVVKRKRAGKYVFYSLSDSHVMSVLSQGLEHAGCIERDENNDTL